MTSRPTYFESRAERILVVEGDPSPRAHKHDQIVHSKHRELARHIQEKLESVQYARLNDLTPTQRQKLFEIVLKDNKSALQKLSDLFQKFQELKNITQRA